MRGGEKLSLEQIQELLKASEELAFAGESKEEVYAWIETTMREQRYETQSKENKGLLRKYIFKMTGLSRAQVTRLIGFYLTTRAVKVVAYRRHRSAGRYRRRDAELPASVDQAHETLSGPATKAILRREYEEFGNAEYVRLAGISVAQLYRLRKSQTYRKQRIHYEATKPAKAAQIGQRRQPKPEGRPGYLRVDTGHQGDRGGVKGVYHINAVDEVTQWQVEACVPQISEAWLKPALEAMLREFPFRIRGFHSDNGSEFINHTAAKLLGKLLIRQTKSRPRRSNGNGLVESKNGAVIRKHMGYTHIAAEHAGKVQRFYSEYFNSYINFHRPSGQPEIVTDAKGKQRHRYRHFKTPWEVLRSLPRCGRYLNPGVTLKALDRHAKSESDTAAARRMQEAKRKLFLDFQPGRSAA